jgi:hypothetical protein
MTERMRHFENTGILRSNIPDGLGTPPSRYAQFSQLSDPPLGMALSRSRLVQDDGGLS